MATHSFEKLDSVKPNGERLTSGLNLVDISGSSALSADTSRGAAKDTATPHMPKLDLTDFSDRPAENATKTAAETFDLSSSVRATRFSTDRGPVVILKDTEGNQLGVVYKGKFVQPKV